MARVFDDHALDVTPILWCVNPLQVMHREVSKSVQICASLAEVRRGRVAGGVGGWDGGKELYKILLTHERFDN